LPLKIFNNSIHPR